MPATGCVGVSGLEERIFLASRFHIERIVTSHHPKRINFSENTGIHECLLVARRIDSPSARREPTEFFSLRRMPTTPEEVETAAEAIAGGQPTEWGKRTFWSSERVVAGDWTPVQWFDGHLAEAAFKINTSPILEPIGLAHHVGPAGRATLPRGFRKLAEYEPGAVGAPCSVSSKVHIAMRLDTGKDNDSQSAQQKTYIPDVVTKTSKPYRDPQTRQPGLGNAHRSLGGRLRHRNATPCPERGVRGASHHRPSRRPSPPTG